MTKPNVLLTGASGFVGRAIAQRLALEGFKTNSILRVYNSEALRYGEVSVVNEFRDELSWQKAIGKAQVVIHCAARVHVMNDCSSDPLAQYRAVNVEGTLALARQAAIAGVKRFIFLSSIKVNGEATVPGNPYRPDQKPEPLDPYGISKMEAEEMLKALAEDSGLEVTIIRPVLVYGPGVKANFHSLMGLLSRGLPLPLGAIPNKRSLVALDNLVDLVMTCIAHPAAANETFLVSDGEDLSTSDLLHRLGLALGRPSWLIPVPVGLVQLGAGLVGKKALAQRLCGSLQVDITKTRSLLGWTPVTSVDEALLKTARHFLKR